MSTQPEVKSEMFSFYTAGKDGEIFHDMGVEVIFPGFTDFQFVLHSWVEDIYDPTDEWEIIDYKDWWWVSEVTTGYRLIDRVDSKEQAVYNAFIKLSKAGPEKVKELIDEKPKVPKYIAS